MSDQSSLGSDDFDARPLVVTEMVKAGVPEADATYLAQIATDAGTILRLRRGLSELAGAVLDYLEDIDGGHRADIVRLDRMRDLAREARAATLKNSGIGHRR